MDGVSEEGITKTWTADDGPVIRLENVSKSFGDNHVIQGMSFDIQVGRTTVIMGESGSGKSVLIKLMNGLLVPDEGRVLLFGKDTREISSRQLMKLRTKIGTLFQNYALFDSMKVAENVAFALVERMGMGRGKAKAKAMELLTTLGLGDVGDLLPSEISGGMKKRVSLARAIITNPEVMLYDEPTTGLDPVMIEFVDDMIVDTRERFGVTSVIISHDMASVFKLADYVAMIEGGKIIFEGLPEAARTSQVESLRNFIDSGTSRLEDLDDDEAEPLPETASLAWDDLPEPEAEPLVRVKNLHKQFGKREVLRGINMYVLPNKITTIIGGSGSGKSVTMKHVLGLFQATSGLVEVFGQDVGKLSEKDLLRMRQKFGMLFQGAALFDFMSVLDNVAFPMMERPRNKLGKKEAREKASEVLRKLRIEELGPKSPDAISNGQRKRVGLARAIASEPKILIYDEPTTGLDPIMTRYVNDMIVEAQEEFHITALVVSHDMASTFRISHQVAMLYLGRIIAFGTPEQVMASRHPKVEEFIFAGSVD